MLQEAHDAFVQEAGDLLRSYPKIVQSQDNNVKNNWKTLAQVIINKGTNFIKFGGISMKNISLISMQLQEIKQKLEQLSNK